MAQQLIQDRDGTIRVVEACVAKYPSVERLLVDLGYAERCAQTFSQYDDMEVQIVRRPRNGNVRRSITAQQSDLVTI